jgi:hypothetical protein
LLSQQQTKKSTFILEFNIKNFYLLLSFVLLINSACAGFPPTATRGSNDSADITTFKFLFPNVTFTHSGTSATFGIVNVASGGTGLGTLTANNLILGNGTSSPTFVAPGTSGNILISNGTTWASSSGIIPRTAYTPSFSSFGTPTGISFFYSVVGKTLRIEGAFTPSANSAASGVMTLPSGYLLDTSKMPISGNSTASAGSMWGWATQNSANTTVKIITSPGTDTALDSVRFGGIFSSSNNLVPPATNTWCNAGVVTVVNFEVPIQ